ncbi:MAG: PQQ-dependent dehydrogenase, methanol/ethanol family [Pseudomonadales bacterium]
MGLAGLRRGWIGLLWVLGSSCAQPGNEAPQQQAVVKVTDTARIAGSVAEPDQWLSHGGGYSEQRFSGLRQIRPETVEGLGLAWYFDFDTHRGQESTPLMVDGVIYVTSAWSKVFALDAATGTQLWRYDPEVPGKFGLSACCDAVNRGAAYYQGKVYVGTLDGRLIALDAASGELVWSTLTVDQSQPYTITGAPRVAKGKVFIGNGGAEYGVRGYVSAYDATTGALSWRFYTVPGDPREPADGAASDAILQKTAANTWHGRRYLEYGGGGGTVWDSIVYDPDLDQLYVGTGNGSPWNRQLRSEGRGDNLFLSSILALNPDTGDYLWHYQETPGETWDYTATQQISLAELEVDGERQKVLMHAPKNGFFYLLNRETGKLVSAEKFIPANWAERIDLETGRPVETPGARYEEQPFLATVGGAGAHNWQPMSYSPLTGLVYIPAQQVPFLYSALAAEPYRPGEWNLGVDLLGTPLPLDASARAEIVDGLQGRLIAWDPVQQREAWRVEHDGPWNGGTLATAGGLVFQGLTDHSFRAYDAASGKLLWQYPTQDAVITAPISFALGDEQYIAVSVGNGGGMPLTLPTFDGPKATPNGRLLVFKLGATERLPDFAPAEQSVVTAQGSVSAVDASRAFALFGRYCAACHGIETLSAGVLPDLRYSPAVANDSLWRAIVRDGAYETKGMVGFGASLSEADVELLRLYVSDQAHKILVD